MKGPRCFEVSLTRLISRCLRLRYPPLNSIRRVGRLRFTEEHRAAIRAFQKSINEPETGLFKRNSVTHRKLSEAARRALRNLPKQPRARLTFDGAALKWHGGRFNGKSRDHFNMWPTKPYILKKDRFNHARICSTFGAYGTHGLETVPSHASNLGAPGARKRPSRTDFRSMAGRPGRRDVST